MTDWIGTPRPPTSSAPPWPRNWRIWWDPRAPHGTGIPSAPPVLNPIDPIVTETPIISGSGNPGCQIWVIYNPDFGSWSGWTTVGSDGTWTYTPPAEFPLGDYCVSVKQRCEDPGDWSAPVQDCFTVAAAPPQIIDFEAKHLRFESVNGWPVYGTLTYKIDGVWTQGVLRRAVEVP